MVNVNVKAMDIGFQAPDSGKTNSTGVKNTQSDQFKKLLEGKQDGSQDSTTQEVSKDGKPEKTEETEKPEEGKDTDTKDTKEDTAEETVSTDDSQAMGLLAAYQMSQGMRPEVLTTEPEVVIEVPEAVQADAEVTAVDPTAAGELIADGMTEQVNVQPEQNVTADTAANFQAEVKTQETVQVKEPEVQAAAPETAETAPIRRETVKTQSTGEETQPQTDDNTHAEQSAAAPVAQAPVRNIQEEIPQEVTKVHVAQPEELPEKLTDQILGKMQEGADSFEIEIEPANLGKIAVKIQYQDGQATVSIFCTEKRALEVLGDRAREIGVIIDKNLGGETKIIVEKQEPDYLNRNNDENQQGKQDEREQQKENHQKQDSEDSEQFLQKLRLGLTV
ncbi:MAG: flagellar hook-length control protein FliK [Ruminococcus sp.]|jgi:flagellar hook-length control protein FliK|nr:flagellar hook-length control protein FliK [uncultured Schaedlerella sp.]MCI8767593.1 flagellar hook-length control protein FliK [Ruminococcus sp.]